MSRVSPSTFATLDVASIGADHPIETTPEGTIAANLNYLYVRRWPHLVDAQVRSDAGAYGQAGNASYVVHYLYRQRVQQDADAIVGYARTSNPGSDDGVVRLTLASDPVTYYAGVTVAAGAAESSQGLTLYQDPAQTRDTVIVSLKKEGVGAQCRLHGLSLRPGEPAIAAGRRPSGYVPLDSDEYAADEPLSVWLRDTMFRNADIIRKTRTATICAWSDSWEVAARDPSLLLHTETSTTPRLVMRIPYRAAPEQTALEWSIFGFREGASGTVTLTTTWMQQQGIASVTQALAALDSSPYAGNGHDDGGSTLAVHPGSSGEVWVYLSGDGTDRAALMGINLWMQAVA